ncbi:MAG: cadmium-translocating P-type ATPase [Nitrososphaerota archaeon]|jgi:Cu2+-exporting ATPase|nr:cadmium-translocating P-type ATPase [Nitrososphaerota archaeon]MDG6927773.1 cadmium-translocating P-type ATPase [Nitrososphaerota archaeon]MDG6930312.1 cadmium-translocating P-type ATPase [Nitrososphaerota archaeon]MDG6932735.1 cadmium-translocating P-type ATPase [Nitrososphaerota archaeon]MDG6935358.1 cadmium-translocating P-type ATPase [Nitrososphaerota archaeon]
MSEKKEKLRIVGMHCATCVNTVTKSIEKVKGINGVSVNLATGYAEVQGDFKLNEVVESVRKAGYDVETQEIKLALNANPEESSRILNSVTVEGVISSHFNPATGVLNLRINPQAVSSKDLVEKLSEYGVTLLNNDKAEVSAIKKDMNSMVYSLIVASLFTALVLFYQYTGNYIYAFVFSIPVIIYSGRRYFKGAFRALRNRTADMDTLVALSAGTAWIYSVIDLANRGEVFFDAASLLVTFVLVGKTLDSYLRYRISYVHVPHFTARLSTGEIVDADQVNVGDIVIVKSGEVIPVDGVVYDGTGEVDESILTGESVPNKKNKGDPATADSYLVNGYLEIYVTRRGGNTYIAQLVQAVNDAGTSSVGLKRTVDRVTAYFTPVIIVIAALTFFVWHMTVPVSEALLFSIAVLASACPCALGLATPLAVLVQVRRLSNKGIIVRRGDALEKARHVKTVIFDKTGTITSGQLRAIPATVVDGSAIAMAAALEGLSSHPVARAISSLSGIKMNVSDFTEFIGEGVMGSVEGHNLLVGKREFIQKNCDKIIDGDIIVCVDGRPMASFFIEDEVRDGVKELIDDLKLNHEVLIATGDSSSFADDLGRNLGVKVLKGLSAQEKAELVKSMENSMFIGDGVNDALAIKQAYVGVSLSSGSDISKQAGDIIVNSPAAIKLLIDGSYKLESRIRENLIWAFGYNAVLVPIAAGILYPAIYLPPQFAALAMSLNSVAVTLWSFFRP